MVHRRILYVVVNLPKVFPMSKIGPNPQEASGQGVFFPVPRAHTSYRNSALIPNRSSAKRLKSTNGVSGIIIAGGVAAPCAIQRSSAALPYPPDCGRAINPSRKEASTDRSIQTRSFGGPALLRDSRHFLSVAHLFCGALKCSARIPPP